MKQRKAAVAELWQQYHHQNIQRAVEISTLINKQYPDWARGWAETSHLALKLNNLKISIRAAEHAISLEPENLEWLLLLLKAMLNHGEVCEVRELLRDISPNEIKTHSLFQEVGRLQIQQGLYTQALATFQAALDKFAPSYHSYFNLAVVQRYLGQLDDAESSFNQAIALNPDDGEAYWLRSTLRKQSNSSNHISELEERNSELSKLSELSVSVAYALAKELEDLGEYERSFNMLKMAADRKRSMLQYDLTRDLSLISAMQSIFDDSLVSKLRSSSSNPGEPQKTSLDPIFIVGFPRSGSTLVERMLSQSDLVDSLGESTLFSQEFRFQAAKLEHAKNRGDLYSLDTIQSIDYNSLADSYLKRASDLCASDNHIINKLPMNAINVGLICLAYKNAKVIWTKRHPLDQCYAMYKNLFDKGYPFSYSFEELAEYYVSLYRLMEHWCQIFPENIHIVEYEDLVTDTEPAAKELYDFCGLPWSERSLEFYKDNSASTTASAAQVRRPIYKSSVALWKRYSEQLSPLRVLLENAGIDCR